MRAREAIRPEHLSELAAILQRSVGLQVRPTGLRGLRLALEARFEELGPAFRGAGPYLESLRTREGEEELRHLLPLITVGKTSFFRDERQFAALSALLPELLARRRAAGEAASIWSAGCATGEEVYSLAIAAVEAGAGPRDLELLGTDVNPRAVAATAAGRFEATRMAEMPPDLLRRHFEAREDAYCASAELRRLVRVFAHNLVSSEYPRPRSGGWDLVFCRNVLIYFDTAMVRRVLARLHAALAPGGLLFLGYSESLFGLFEGFELTEVEGAFLYRRSRSLEEPRRTAPRAHPAPRPTTGPPPAPPPVVPARSAEAARARAAELLEGGRFEAARELLEQQVSVPPKSLALRLTLANLYAVLRDAETARASYRTALDIEPLHAETHLFCGIERLGEGDPDGAAQALSRALFLDPDLAIGHYFLGRCREAQCDAQRARLSFKNAIDACRRNPGARRKVFLGYYPDLPEDADTVARMAKLALAAL